MMYTPSFGQIQPSTHPQNRQRAFQAGFRIRNSGLIITWPISAYSYVTSIATPTRLLLSSYSYVGHTGYRDIMSASTSSLPPSQARLAALNRLKAKEKFASAGKPSSSNAVAGSSRNPQQGTQYVNKQAAAPASARNMVQQQQQEEPLKRNPGLVSRTLLLAPSSLSCDNPSRELCRSGRRLIPHLGQVL